MEITSDCPADFRAGLHAIEMGPVTVWSVITSACCELRRTASMTRRFDPGLFHLVLPIRGQLILKQDHKEAQTRHPDLVFHDTARPARLCAVTNGGMARGIMVLIPRALVSLPEHRTRELAATPFSGRSGVAALLTQFLNQLSGDGRVEAGKQSHAAHLGMVVVDLFTAVLTDALDGDLAPARTSRRTMLAQIQAFIQRRLTDPGLTPDLISQAHHISTRYLHQLFHEHDQTVAGWIRQCRLERCLRDLANPLLRTRPIHAIAERWGFVSGAHFSRVFRASYGIAPSDYRRLADR